MKTNANSGIRALNVEELELVGAGNDAFTNGIRTYDWWFRVAADYWFNAEGGSAFHASNATQQGYVNQ